MLCRLTQRSHPLQGSLREVSRWGDAVSLFEPCTNAVVVTAAVAPALTAQATWWLRHCPARVLATLAANASSHAALSTLLGGCEALAHDVAAWSELLSDLTGCDAVGVRLARVETAMCPAWHADRVSVRAVVTYVGAGTEVVADERQLVRWPRLEVAAPQAIYRVAPGAALFMKGEAWPGNQQRGCVHRSPAASADAPRLVLTLDPLWD